MTLPEHKIPFDRDRIRAEFYPFARPDFVEGLVIGNDLDSLLSAAYLQQRFNWPVRGVYCEYTRLWHEEPAVVFQDKLLSGRYLAVDLDVCHLAVPCIGHHVIQLAANEELPGHTHTLNPNRLAGRTIANGFRQKYPLATLHFLLWLWEENDLAEAYAPLVWLADSAFINAQHYRANVEEWVRSCLPLPSFLSELPALQTRAFEEKLRRDWLLPLAENSLCKAASQSSYFSKNLRLNGFQCQFETPSDPRLPDLLERLHRWLGWPRLAFPAQFSGVLTGERRRISTEQVQQSGFSFAEWLERNAVFSYAFVFKNQLNFTSGLLRR